MSALNLTNALAAVEAAIETKATGVAAGDVKSFNIDGLNVAEFTLGELLEWQEKLRTAIAADGAGHITIARRIPTQ